MKTNLKNFPKLRSCAIEDYGMFAKQYTEETRNWFEAFEKELLEMLEKQKNCPEQFYAEMEAKYPNKNYTSECVMLEVLGDV